MRTTNLGKERIADGRASRLARTKENREWGECANDAIGGVRRLGVSLQVTVTLMPEVATMNPRFLSDCHLWGKLLIKLLPERLSRFFARVEVAPLHRGTTTSAVVAAGAAGVRRRDR
jgi:hypothetical protein